MINSRREVTDRRDVLDILKRCQVCNVAFGGDEFPYVIPLNFGMTEEDGALVLYFHGAGVGKKLDLLQKSGRVGFAASTNCQLVKGDKPCDYTMHYESVCGSGEMTTVDEGDKERALAVIMNQYAQAEHYAFDASCLRGTTVLKLTVAQFTGKRIA